MLWVVNIFTGAAPLFKLLVFVNKRSQQIERPSGILVMPVKAVLHIRKVDNLGNGYNSYGPTRYHLYLTTLIRLKLASKSVHSCI